MEIIKLDSNYSKVKKILHFVEFWKHEYYITPIKSTRPILIHNDDENIFWSFKNDKYIEIIIKYLTNDLKREILSELKKEKCKVKIIKIKDNNYKLIIKPNNFSCSIL